MIPIIGEAEVKTSRPTNLALDMHAIDTEGAGIWTSSHSTMTIQFSPWEIWRPRRETIMSLIHFTMQHGRTLDEARVALEQAVGDVRARFGPMVRKADWDPDRTRVRLEGVGFWAEIGVDTREVHASGDIPILGGLLGGSLGTGIKQIVRRSFEKGLPGRTTA